MRNEMRNEVWVKSMLNMGSLTGDRAWQISSVDGWPVQVSTWALRAFMYFAWLAWIEGQGMGQGMVG